MAPGRRRGSGRAAAAAAASQQQWKVGDLVLAKMKGFPAWPAMISEPEKWGFSSVRKKLLVYFYGTKQIAFCNYADIEAFTEEKKKSLLLKRQGKGADFVRAVNEIIDIYETLKNKNFTEPNARKEGIETNLENLEFAESISCRKILEQSSDIAGSNKLEEEHASKANNDVLSSEVGSATSTGDDSHNKELINEPIVKVSVLDQLRHNPLATSVEGFRAERSAKNNEPGSLSEVEMLESSCQLETSTNGCLQNEIGLNAKLEPLKNIVVFKKKRRPNRKRLSNAVECATLEEDSQVELGTMSESPKSLEADGDEHLPFVKRARVRMSKPVGKVTQPSLLVGLNDISVVADKIENCDKHSTSPSAENNYLSNGTLPSKEGSNSLPKNNCSLPSASDTMFWKAKYQLKGFDLDVEAALPPSKRLHRALEAMSANAAEAKDDCTKSPKTTEFNVCKESPKMSSPTISSFGENFGSHIRLQRVQSSDSNGLKSTAFELPTDWTTPALSPSEVKSDEVGRGYSSADKKEYNEVLHDTTKFDKEYVSDGVAADFHTKFSHPCSSELFEEVDATSFEGMADQLCFSSDKVNKNEILADKMNENENLQFKEECCNWRIGNIDGNEIVEPVIEMQDSYLKAKRDSDLLPKGAASDVVATVSITFGATNSSSIPSDENIQTPHMQNCAKEFRQIRTPNDRCNSPDLTPMKELIAAAQAKRLVSRSTSFTDNYAQKAVISPSAVNKEDSCRHVSPSFLVNHKFATDDRLLALQNCGAGRSPQLKDFYRSANIEEANAARKAFEAFLCTLSRTKESIGRATRLAIDCAKHGIPGEVIDILVQDLEREPNLYKRIDLFFLVDSITQCSKNLKGEAGDVYPSLVQSVLPRLLSAAAPQGNAASENRRQCLKVLRVWLERKTLPESIIRHHMRELDSLNEVSSSSCLSRRPSRTERAFNDPVREMEGMLVDEYGSNTSFQIPSLLSINVLEDEKGCASDEKSFEAVTPERHDDADHEKETAQAATGKHKHILEDIDGELEMEDLAPPCEVEASSTCHVPGTDAICYTHLQNDQQQSPFAPPLPEDRPPSPPPLPSSPPPFAPPCSMEHTIASHHQLRSHAVSDTANLHLSSTNNSLQIGRPQSLIQQSGMSNVRGMTSESMPYYAPGGLPKLPPPASLNSSGSYRNFPASHPDMQSRNNCPPLVNTSLTSKPYCLQPPPPTVSNQFSYINTEPHQRGRPLQKCFSFPERLHHMHHSQGGKFYADRVRRGPILSEMSERSLFSPAFCPGPLHSDKVEAPSVSREQYVPCEHPPIPCNGWSVPPRIASYSSFASRPSLESTTSRLDGAPGYWRPR